MVRDNIRPFTRAAGMIIIPAAILFFMAGCANTAKNANDTDRLSSVQENGAVLYLDGCAVSPEEYEMLAREYSNRIYMQYSSEQINSDGFWETEYDGITPCEQLAEMTENELRTNYALKMLAVELGVTEDYSYAELMVSMEEENSDREDAVDSDGEFTYGLSSYDSFSWYTSWYSNLETQVINALIEDEIDVSDSDCREYYEENADSYAFELGVTLLYAELSLDGTDVDAHGDMFLPARSLAAAMDCEEDVSVLEEAFPDFTIEQLELTSLDTQEGMSGIYSNRWEIASSLTEGEIYGPYEDNGRICVMKCISRVENGVLDYDTVKERIESALQTQEAQDMIDTKAEKISVEEGEKSTSEVILEAVY